ncbi:MAG: hypothetical protein ACPIOQ_74515, partial [Promethearchaeia archaeon]
HALERKLIPLLANVGKDRPWSKGERGAVFSKIMALTRKYGSPSHFYTISLDDVHQALSVRLSHASQSNARFPAFTRPEEDADGVEAELDASGFTKMLNALRRLDPLAPADGDEWPQEIAAKPHVVKEAILQRLATDNPVATSETYQRVVDIAHKVLFALPDAKDRRGNEVDAKGIFGTPVAHIHVTETQGRGSLHVHGALWTQIAPECIAGALGDDAAMEAIRAALETQVRAHVDWEVHIVHRAQQALSALPRRRASLQDVPHELDAQSRGDIGYSALGVGDHVCKAGCHKTAGKGRFQCREAYPKGRNTETGIVQLIPRDEEQSDDERCNELGHPGCPEQWPIDGVCSKCWDPEDNDLP